MRVQLNKRTIDQATYQGPGGCYLWDAEVRGFGLRIYPTGLKSFVLAYRHKGRQRFFTVGRFGELTLQQARPSSYSAESAKVKIRPAPKTPTAPRRPWQCSLTATSKNTPRSKTKPAAPSVTAGRGIAAFCRRSASAR